MRWRSRLRSQSGSGRPDPLLRALRAPRLSVFRPRLPRLRRPRAHHRHLQAYPPGAPLRPAVHRPGAGWSRDHGVPLAHPAGPWRRRVPRGDASLHPEARRPRIRVDDADHLLAGKLRVEPSTSRRVSEHCSLPRKRASSLKPLNRLFEGEDLSAGTLPPQLAELYDGGLAIREGPVYPNFVTPTDRTTPIHGRTAPSRGLISRHNQPHRFVLALLPP